MLKKQQNLYNMIFNNVSFFKSCYLKNQLFLSKKKEIVFVGCSNAGKSSIINKLFNRKKLARVSNKPGKTISINFYATQKLFFVDFPGYGFAKIEKSKQKIWDDLINSYFSSNRNIVLAILVLDIRRGLKDLDFFMIRYLISKNIFFAVILNKVDKLTKNQITESLENIKNELKFIKNLKIILFSSKTGQGVENLKEYVKDILKNEDDLEDC